MGIFRRARRTVASTSPRAITAAARSQEADGDDPASRPPIRKPEEWQHRSWGLYDELGEVHFAAQYLADAYERTRLFIGVQPDPESDPRPIADEGDNTIGEHSYTAAEALAAKAALNRLRSKMGGQAEIQRRVGLNGFVAGEMWLVGEPLEGDDWDETWDVYSIDELDIDWTAVAYNSAGVRVPRVTVKPAPGVQSTKRVLPLDSCLLRIWQPHPRYREWPDSPMRSAMGILEELLILTRSIMGIARSRIHQSGILILPSSMRSSTPAATGSEPSTDPVVADILAATGQAISDPASAFSQVPPIFFVNDDLWKEGFGDKALIRWDRPFDETAAELRSELIRRYGISIDLPAEILTGVGNMKYYNAGLILEETFKSHIEPKVIGYNASLTSGYLHRVLTVEGVRNPERFLIWHDASQLVAPADRSDQAARAHELALISDETARRDFGYGDEDAPTNDELDARMLREIARRAPSLLGRGEQSETRPGPAPPPPAIEAPEPDRQAAASFQAAPLATATVHARDASFDGITERLAELDAGLLRDLHHAAEQALARILEKANARIRSAAHRDRIARAAVEGVQAHTLQVAPTLGPTLVAQVLDGDPFAGEFDDNEVHPEAVAMAALLGRWTSRTDAAHDELLDIAANYGTLDDAAAVQARDELSVAQSAGWLLLASGIAALARERLYRPEPDGPPGEAPGSLVPPGLVRSALISAGGGGEGAASFVTGARVHALWASAGFNFGGYQWRYGDPTARRANFEPHRRLNALRFDGRGDEVLRNTASFPPTSHFWPGDHKGCLCTVVLTAPRRISRPSVRSLVEATP